MDNPRLIQLVFHASVQHFVRQHLHRRLDHLAQLGRRSFLRPVRGDLALVRSAAKLATVMRTNNHIPSQYPYREATYTKQNLSRTYLKSDMSGLMSVDARIVCAWPLSGTLVPHSAWRSSA